MRRSTPGKQLQRMREQMLKQQDRVKLLELGAKLKAARARRDAALKATVTSCRRWRGEARERVNALRAAELAKLAQEVKELRLQARAKCQARKHRIRIAGGRAVDQRRATLAEERRLQAQLMRLADHARKRKSKHATTSKERRQESDDYVRGNLPAELQPVFDRVKRQIKGGPRTTRTEAFLEWASENPDDVLHHQSSDVDREVAELVREHEAVAGRLRKGQRAYKPLAVALAEAVPF